MSIADIAAIPVRSPAAERMQRHRERKKNGMQCVMVEMRNEEIEALIQKQLLKSELRKDHEAIADALYKWFEQSLA
jgi:hypothetical protein